MFLNYRSLASTSWKTDQNGLFVALNTAKLIM